MVTSKNAEVAGTPVVAGLAYGPILMAHVDAVDPEQIASGIDDAAGDEAMARYDDAAAQVAEGFRAKSGRASGAAAEVLAATAGLATDKGLRQAVEKQLGEDGVTLGAAVRGAIASFVDIFTQMGGLMAERATDLHDIERRVLARLAGLPEPGVPNPDEPSILVAADLAPADTAGLDPELVISIVTERGGPTSHTAIIARQLAIPCVVGASGALEIPEGAHALVDGSTGTIEIDPDADDAQHRAAAYREEQAALESWEGPGRTADGHSVKILANVADGASARSATSAPVEGVGLFRTELCFLNATDEPTVEQQAAIYQEVLDAFGPDVSGGDRYVVVRTLDAGSDKPLAFANLTEEENPALGVRGLRLSFGNPGLLHRQLDAVGAAATSSGTETWVMAPMVATVAEAKEFATQARDRGLKAGVMVEVPSAALLAERILQHVDFLSIGTNDLTQYTMAADRMSSDLAQLSDPWQPAVLQLVATTARAGEASGKSVGVCGEAAADPLLACVLVGAGITSLSMAPAAVRGVGARLGAVTLEQCQAAAAAALAASDPMAAREAARDALR